MTILWKSRKRPLSIFQLCTQHRFCTLYVWAVPHERKSDLNITWLQSRPLNSNHIYSLSLCTNRSLHCPKTLHRQSVSVASPRTAPPRELQISCSLDCVRLWRLELTSPLSLPPYDYVVRVSSLHWCRLSLSLTLHPSCPVLPTYSGQPPHPPTPVCCGRLDSREQTFLSKTCILSGPASANP